MGELAFAQRPLNCEAGAGGNLQVLPQHSFWSGFAANEASVICNFALGQSMGMAITVDYRCKDEADKTWEKLKGSRHEIGTGTFERSVNPGQIANRVKNEFIHRQKVDNDKGFTGFVGKFPKQEHFFWRWGSRTIVTIVMMSGQGITIDRNASGAADLIGASGSPSLEKIVFELVNKHYANIQCPLYKIIDKTPNQVTITRPVEIPGAEADHLYDGDVIRLSRESNDPGPATIEIESLIGPEPRWRGIAVFRGEDTFYDEFTIQLFPNWMGWSWQVGGMISFGVSATINWILKTVSTTPGTGLFLNTTKSSTAKDLVFINLRSVVVVEPLANKDVRLITLEGNPEVFYDEWASKVSVGTGKYTLIDGATPSRPETIDLNTVNRWWEPVLGTGNGGGGTNPPPPPPGGTGLQVVRHVIASDVDQSPCCSPVGVTSSFSPQDPQIISFVEFSNHQNALGTPLKWVFYNPQGSAQGELTIPLDNRYHWVSIALAGEALANMTGRWTVKFYINNSFAFEDTFTITRNNQQPPASTCFWTGTWDTSTGSRMSLIQQGSDVVGSYVNGGAAGSIDGTIVDGVFVGIWEEPPFGSFDTGNFQMGFDSSSCDTFDGVWNFTGNPPWRSWTGVRVSDTPISLSAVITPLQLASVQTVFRNGQLQFLLNGSGIQSAQVQVFDLSGRMVHDSGFAVPHALQWNLNNAQGRPVANGVYLYVVTVRGLDGTTLRSQVKKVMVLR